MAKGSCAEYVREVTAITNPGNIELVSSLGADHVIDYTVEDFTKNGARFDVIVDNGGTPSRIVLSYRRSRPRGQ